MEKKGQNRFRNGGWNRGACQEIILKTQATHTNHKNQKRGKSSESPPLNGHDRDKIPPHMGSYLWIVRTGKHKTIKPEKAKKDSWGFDHLAGG